MLCPMRAKEAVFRIKVLRFLACRQWTQGRHYSAEGDRCGWQRTSRCFEHSFACNLRRGSTPKGHHRTWLVQHRKRDQQHAAGSRQKERCKVGPHAKGRSVRKIQRSLFLDRSRDGEKVWQPTRGIEVQYTHLDIQLLKTVSDVTRAIFAELFGFSPMSSKTAKMIQSMTS